MSILSYMKVWKWQSPSLLWFFIILWTVACLVPLSLKFSRQEYRSEYPFPSPEDLPNPGTEPSSPALQADSLPFEHTWEINQKSWYQPHSQSPSELNCSCLSVELSDYEVRLLEALFLLSIFHLTSFSLRTVRPSEVLLISTDGYFYFYQWLWTGTWDLWANIAQQGDCNDDH